jgi:hypothetical protein
MLHTMLRTLPLVFDRNCVCRFIRKPKTYFWAHLNTPRAHKQVEVGQRRDFLQRKSPVDWLQSAGQQLHRYRYYLLSWALGHCEWKVQQLPRCWRTERPTGGDLVAFSATGWERSEVSASRGRGDEMQHKAIHSNWTRYTTILYIKRSSNTTFSMYLITIDIYGY